MEEPESTVAHARGIGAAARDWWPTGHRDLPWRSTTPWGVLVSEFMLQQTQVQRVLPQWTRFLELWPTPEAMAASEASIVQREWGRLGYPRRALWLYRCAQEISHRFGGNVPRDVDVLERITGIGPYTARAIAAFAYGVRVPVVDANTRRVLARSVLGLVSTSPGNASADHALMLQSLPKDADLALITNQAVMEIGALKCRARAPLCDSCPLAGRCAWLASGRPGLGDRTAPKQASYKGSLREARGAVLERLRASKSRIPVDVLVGSIRDDDISEQRIEKAVASLARDGIVHVEAGLIALAS